MITEATRFTSGARLFLFAALLSLIATGATAGGSGEKVKLRAELEPTVTADSENGKVRWRLRASRSRLDVRARGLSAGQSYAIEVDGVEVANFQANSSGRGRIRFETPAKKGSKLLDFDPRGSRLTVAEGNDDLLELDLASSSSSNSEMRLDEKTRIQPTALGAGGKAKARFRIRNNGRQSFSVEIEDVPSGNYSLFVGGIERGLISVSAGEGEIEFDTDDPPKPLLDFDPRGLIIDIAIGTDVFFSGPMEAQIGGVNECTFSESEVFLPATAAGAGGKAKARTRTRDDCDRDFRVEVEDVPAGDYELFVDGVNRGTIPVAFDASSGELEGEIEFDTDPDDADEQLLDFDPVGASVEVRQGAVVFFSTDSLDPGGPGGTCDESEDTVLLVPTAAAPGAKGEARLRDRDDCDRDFRVEIEDLPAGDYDLVVGGVARGVIAVAFDPSSGEFEGEIEFDTDADEPDEVPLDFDPSGQDVEIFQAGVLLLASNAPPGTGDPGSCSELETELPLLNSGAAPAASGEARFRIRDDCRRSFRVEVEDLPAGDYALLVGGIVRGNLASGGPGTEAELEFDTDDAPKPFLDFDPRGMEIAIESGGTTFLSRDFPL